RASIGARGRDTLLRLTRRHSFRTALSRSPQHTSRGIAEPPSSWQRREISDGEWDAGGWLLDAHDLLSAMPQPLEVVVDTRVEGEQVDEDAVSCIDEDPAL